MQRSTLVKNAPKEIRLGFIRKVYGILATQLILTTAIGAKIASIAFTMNPAALAMLINVSLVLSLVTMCAMTCCPQVTRKYPTNYAFLFMFTVAEAILVGVVAASYTKASVLAAVGLTAAIFIGLTIFAITTKEDYTGMGPYLAGFLIALIVFGFGISMMGFLGFHVPLMHKLYAFAGVVIFVLFIVYDTQMVIGSLKGHKHEFSIDEYVFAALNLYIDIINLFLELLKLLGKESRDRGGVRIGAVNTVVVAV